MTIPACHYLKRQKKKTKNKITSGVKNFLQLKAIKPPSNRIAASSSLKRKVKTSKKSRKKPRLSNEKFTL